MYAESHQQIIGPTLKVSSHSSASSVAGAIAGMIKDDMLVEIQAIGAGAVNQAVKAIAISRGFLSPMAIDIACVPSFIDIEIGGEQRTAIRFSVQAQSSSLAINTANYNPDTMNRIDSTVLQENLQ